MTNTENSAIPNNQTPSHFGAAATAVLLFHDVKSGFESVSNKVSIPNHPPDAFVNFWTKRVGIPPQDFLAHYEEILEGLNIQIKLSTTGADTLELELTAGTAGQGFTGATTKTLKEKRSFDLANGVINPGFINNPLGKAAPAREILRKSFELGHILGCNTVNIEATRTGAYLWTQCFNIDRISPKYTAHMKERLGNIQTLIAHETYTFLYEAIDRGDLEAIAQCGETTPHRLKNRAYMRLYEQTVHQTNPPPITIGKYILMDDMVKCWLGSADLQNPRDCARLESVLGRWRQPELRTRAKLNALSGQSSKLTDEVRAQI
ncbi:MAG: hypothetical protein H6861_05885 [Rhodospirillales bacterium]|nr:hypothetical protein [Rhodospirillales bacterium]